MNNRSERIFIYLLGTFNLLFLAYVFTVGYYNRLAVDDYAYVGIMRDYGFNSPFTYWYTNWQGRFVPQYFLNVMYLIYEVTKNLFFYPVLLSFLFIYSIYQILRYYFSLPKFVLLNYSILLFSGLLLTTLEFNTFYWLVASVMYFGGILFALLGASSILKKRNKPLDYLIIAVCFLYVGSSAEHVGSFAPLSLLAVVLYNLYKSNYQFRTFLSYPINKKLLTALFFCSLAFAIMILAPGTSFRMAQAQHAINPFDLLEKTIDATLFVCGHIFYKLPYYIVFIPLFLFLGSTLDNIRVKPPVNFITLLVLAVLSMLILIFVSNIPFAYVAGRGGPLRSYVYVNAVYVFLTFLVCLYAGFTYKNLVKRQIITVMISLFILFTFVCYTFWEELPLLKKYNSTDKERILILTEYKKQKRKEPVMVKPLYNPQYLTITDMWRSITYTEKFPNGISDMPIMINELNLIPDWRNGHLKAGLNLDFDVFLAPENGEKSNEDSVE